MKTIFKGIYHDVCKLTPGEAHQIGVCGRFAVLDRFYEKSNSFNNICNVFQTEQEAKDWISEHE